MKSRILVLALIVIGVQLVCAQKKKTPANITEAINLLEVECRDSFKTIVKRTHNDSLIDLCYPWDGDFKTIYDWIDRDNKKSKIRKYLEEYGLSSNRHQQTVILIAFKESLLGHEVKEDKIFGPYQAKERKWAREDSSRFTIDSLRGKYIPSNLEDCFRQIDGFWSDSTKAVVRQWSEDDFTARAHHGFGTWIRNNWQLWGGSRLSKYFNEMGIYHPDDMSGIILAGYHRYLTGKEIYLDGQINYYKSYWEVHREPLKDIYPKGVRNLEFDVKLNYTLKEGNLPGCIHIQTNSKSDMIWIYDFHFGWKRLSQSEIHRLRNDPDNREEILQQLFGIKD